MLELGSGGQYHSPFAESGECLMISGSVVALVTPMLEDGSIDWANLDRLVDLHVAAGTAGIVAVGTTGESATLNVTEHCQVITRVVGRVDGRCAVIAGTGANATSEAIELTRSAHEVGADACLLVTPYYNKPTQEGLYQHFKAVAEAVPVAQWLYNVPGRTACDLSNDTALRLAEIDNIVAIKDATGDVKRGAELIKAAPEGFQVFSGDDATALELILAGGSGNVSVTANVAPVEVAEVCRLGLAGDRQAAEALNARLQLLNTRLFLEANPIPVKWALSEMGLIEQGIRLPMTPLSAQYHDAVREALDAAQIQLPELS